MLKSSSKACALLLNTLHLNYKKNNCAVVVDVEQCVTHGNYQSNKFLQSSFQFNNGFDWKRGYPSFLQLATVNQINVTKMFKINDQNTSQTIKNMALLSL